MKQRSKQEDVSVVKKTLEIEEEILIDAERELVYRFFTEADLIARWHGVAAEADPKPGGIFNLNVTGKHYKVGEFVELVEPSRIVFTWGHPAGVDDFPPGSSTVTVTLTEEGGQTRVLVQQTGFPNVAQRDGHSKGWRHYLTRLETVAAGADPGRDPKREIG